MPNFFAASKSLYVTVFTPTNIRMLLTKIYFLPAFMYGCELFGSCDAVNRRRLNVTYNAIAKYIFGIRRNKRISRFARLISFVTFDNLTNCSTLLFLYKLIYYRQPPYLYERLMVSRSNIGNGINSIKYKIISEQLFSIHSIRLWNQLPSCIQTISNAKHFKTAILMHLVNVL